MIHTNTAGLPGDPWMPSNGTEGAEFRARMCDRCDRECGRSCAILTASFIADVPEWRELENGATTCIAFVPIVCKWE